MLNVPATLPAPSKATPSFNAASAMKAQQQPTNALAGAGGAALYSSSAQQPLIPGSGAANSQLQQAINTSPAGAGINNALAMLQNQLSQSSSLGADNGAQAAARAMLPTQLQRLDLQLRDLGLQQGAANRGFGQLGASEQQTKNAFGANQANILQQLALMTRGTSVQNQIRNLIGGLDQRRYAGMEQTQEAQRQQALQQLTTQTVGAGGAGSAGYRSGVGNINLEAQGIQQRFQAEQQQALQQARLAQYNNNLQLGAQRLNAKNQLVQNQSQFNKNQIDYLKQVQDLHDTLGRLGIQGQDIGLQKQLAQIGAAHAGAGSNAALQMFMAQTGLVGQIAQLTAQQGALGQSIMGMPQFQNQIANQFQSWITAQQPPQQQPMAVPMPPPGGVSRY